MNKKGLTVFELLVTVGLFSFFVTMTVPGLRSLFARLEVHEALCTLTSGLNAARTLAIRDNLPVRAEVVPGKLLLSQDDGAGWRVIRSFALGGKLAVCANSRPVFSPLGNVSPLCTITLQKERRVWRVVVSMYGRVQVRGNG